jgi:hypothetical protein
VGKRVQRLGSRTQRYYELLAQRCWERVGCTMCGW